MSTLIRYGYNSNHAGETLLKETSRMRKALYDAVPSADYSDDQSVFARLERIGEIRNMDYKEVETAYKALCLGK